MHGHLLGAAGAVEAAVSLASLQMQLTPATLGLMPLDERCKAVNAQEVPRATTLRTVMSNSFAFGGSNVSLIFKSIPNKPT
jgi:3-oxoacyl-[acyl-carrier-protein] synthase II